MTELNIISDMNQNLPQTPPTTASSVRVKAPRRILHFSDGTLEEYSTDDEPDSPDNSNQNKQIDLQKLNWNEWCVHQMMHGGNRVLAACDFVGEKLASAFGITTPKYGYEIEQFKKIQKEHENAKAEEKTIGGWMQDTYDNNSTDKTKSECVITQEKMQKY